MTDADKPAAADKSADRVSVLGEPFLKVGELHRAGLLECTGGESAHPVVMHTEGCGDGPVLPYTLPDRFTRPLDTLFDACGG